METRPAIAFEQCLALGDRADIISIAVADQGGAVEAVFFENVVLSVLAVGGYRLERVFALLPALREHGITLGGQGLDEREAFLRLQVAGYNRGPIVTAMIAKRVVGVHAALHSGLLRSIAQRIRSGETEEARTLALRIPGIGPAVFDKIMLLNEIPVNPR